MTSASLERLEARVSIPEQMAQWEIHELRNILNWIYELTWQAGMTTDHLARALDARIERLHHDQASELRRLASKERVAA